MKKHHRKTKNDSIENGSESPQTANRKNEFIDKQAPDGDFVENYANPSEFFSMAEAAKIAGLEEKALIELLVAEGVLYYEEGSTSPQAHSEWIEKGYFVNAPADAIVTGEHEPPTIEEIEATKRRLEFDSQIIEIDHQIIQVLERITAINNQIAEAENQITNARNALVKTSNLVVKTEYINGLSDESELHGFLLMSRESMHARAKRLLKERESLLFASPRG